MAASLREALRERLTFKAVAHWVVAAAILWYLLDPSPAQFATTAVSMAVFGLTELVTDVYDVRQSVRNVGLGIYALVSGTAMLLFGDPNVVAIPVAFLLVGAWFVLDAVQTARHVGATESERTGREVYHSYVGRQIDDRLADGPRTRRELSEALDADEEAIDAALDDLASRGVVAREGSTIRAADPDDDGLAGKIRGLARRIVRPVTLELERDGEAADADPTHAASPDPGYEGMGPDGSNRDAGATRSGASRERERESVD